MGLLDAAKTNFILAFSFLIAISLVSCAAEPYSFDTWDYDDDLYLEEDEFYSGLGDLGYYDMWNYNGEDYLTEEEWDEGIDIYFDTYDSDEVGDFEEWDENGDGMLSEEEFESGIFDMADSNDDEQIDDEEFDEWYDEDEI